MIPRTFPSIVDGNNNKTKARVFFLSSVTNLSEWIDYIPVKTVAPPFPAVANTYANNGYLLVDIISDATGLAAGRDYVALYDVTADVNYNKPWSTDIGGYIPIAEEQTPITYYFMGSDSSTWSDLGNWFEDEDALIAATSLPTAIDSVISFANIESEGSAAPIVVNNFTMQDPSFDGYVLDITITVTGVATFNGGSALEGTVIGNAIFNDSSILDGTVDGNVTLNDTSTTTGNETVTGTTTDNRP